MSNVIIQRNSCQQMNRPQKSETKKMKLVTILEQHNQKQFNVFPFLTFHR